ncbi:hypothetical protein SAMN05443999_103276 [Roseovarius azorensis]|uniref:Uncharacterized protein n=1 Tax=Roseovarius azorensis TaxID=1287727 RepID=A0A1H7MD65_9RHOB|nr:hypothetical protein [Roseovarius azorensis]SEL09031.1 hypothetical protein SAMN05443999_103276 [Roseovarius azorensis]
MNKVPETSKDSFVTIFDDTYDQPDCRAYFRMMDALGYRNQHHAVAAFRAGLAELVRLRGLSVARILDFASSYGIVTALMAHDLTLAQVFARYREARFDSASPAEVMAWDRDWLAGLRRRDLSLHVTGLDVMPNAVAYGRAVGLFDAGFAEDLEVAAPSEALAAELARCDMIVECGSVAQLMPRALDRLLAACAARKPWVMTSPIRGNERSAATEVLQAHGLVVEALPIPPFVHRRFESAGEQARAIENARAAGHVTEGVETTGHFHAQVLLARPADEATPVSDWALPVEIAPMRDGD